MRHRKPLRVALLSATYFTGGMFAGPVMAQEGSAEDQAGDQVIIVTGTRRATTLMDTPINITALGAEELQVVASQVHRYPGLTQVQWACAHPVSVQHE